MASKEFALRRMFKVLVRSVHLVGTAGTFANAMMNISSSIYITTVIWSGLLLVLMESFGNRLWLVQLRGIAIYAKLILIGAMHWYPQTAIPCLIAIIMLSGFMSHAPSWIRYYSVQHRKVVHEITDILG